MRPKQTTADDTDITDVVEAFVPNVCVGADPLGTADTTAQRSRGYRRRGESLSSADFADSADSDS